MAWKYPIIYWNCGVLLSDCGAMEETGGSTDYGKIATAVSTMKHWGVNIALPSINEAEKGFIPNVEEDRIFYALQAINGIGSDLCDLIIANRPYTSMQDFYYRMITPQNEQPALIKPAQMVKLIKAGCFVELDNADRTETMKHFINNYLLSPCTKLTLSQLGKMQELNIVPDHLKRRVSFLNFKKYILDDCFLHQLHIEPDKKMLKCGYHDRYFKLDVDALRFFKEHFTEDSIVGTTGATYLISEKKFEKEVDAKLEPLRDWFLSDEALETYNEALFTELWKKHASGTISTWEMEALSFYYSEHELVSLNEPLYGVVNFFELPEEPEVYDYYTRWIKGERKDIPKFRIDRLAGTVINSDNNHHMITLLTQYGVVNCKFNKGQYAWYNRTMSEANEKGNKSTTDKSWFKRGTKLIISGYRQDSQFRVYNYNDSIWRHCVYRIQELFDNGEVLLQTERGV